MSTREEDVAEAIHNAEEIFEPPLGAGRQKPRILVDNSNPDLTVSAIRDVLAESGDLYDRGAPTRLVFDQRQNGYVAHVLTPENIVMAAHERCRPYKIKEKDGVSLEVDCRLPRALAVMYRDWHGEWRLRPLNGIAT